MAYRLLALDLDGTILDAMLTLPDAVIDAVAEAQRRGVLVTLATGRTFAATAPFARRLGITGPVICYQGGLVLDVASATVRARFPMRGDLAAAATNRLLASDLFVLVYGEERLYIREYRPELELYMQFHPEGVEIIVEPNLAAMTAEIAPLKVQFIAEPPIVERELALLAREFGEQLTVIRSHAIFGEFTPLGVSKGAALAALAEQVGIAREQVAAIGDHENDLSMIRWAGLGMAVGNAIPEVLAVADVVLPPVEQAGVAEGIWRYLLKDEG